MNRQTGVVFAALLFLAALTGWLADLLETPRSRSDDAKLRHDPDYFMEHFELTAMDEKGQVGHRLRSDKLLHYPDDDTTELTNPHIVVYREKSEPWHIRSERGSFTTDAELVLLSGAVTIERAAGQDNQPVKLTTTNLRIRPKDEFAETDARVTVIGKQQRTEALGLRAYLQDGQLQLLKDVRMVYE